MTESRRDRVRDLRPTLEVDALIVSDLVNVRYLTGLASSNASVLVADSDVLFTDARYFDVASRLDVAVAAERDVVVGGVRAAAEQGALRIGLESAALTVAEATRITRVADELGVTVVMLDPVVETLRACKDPDEIRLLQEACTITEAALTAVFDEVHLGLTERWIAARLEFLMRDMGAEAAAFASIVAGGPLSAEPHHEPTDRPLAAGDLLKIDCGARVQGYHADLTRTVVVGASPTDWQREIHAVVAEAAACGRAALRAGEDLAVVDAAARTVVGAAGYGPNFEHGLGHGIGLRIHEAPALSATSVGTLGQSMTVTVEPGVYLPGLGGVRIEDSLVVTADGAEPLTTMNRDLLVLG